jgi:hypothetical protein
MSGIGLLLLAAGSNGPRDLANAGPYGNTTSGYAIVKTNGNVEAYSGGSLAATQKWYDPTTSGIGSSYWVRFTVVSGNTPGGSDYNPGFGSWLALTSDRQVGFSYVGGYSRSAVIRIEIAADSGGAAIVSSGDYTLQVLAQPAPYIYAWYSPDPVSNGASYTLTWITSDCTGLTFDVTGAYTSSGSLNPAGGSDSATCTFTGVAYVTFTATGPGGTTYFNTSLTGV